MKSEIGFMKGSKTAVVPATLNPKMSEPKLVLTEMRLLEDRATGELSKLPPRTKRLAELIDSFHSQTLPP